MSLMRKIAHNTVLQVAGRLGGGILSVLALALITRYLGREGFGIYTTIIAFLQFFAIVANFGLTTITLQMVAERDDPQEINKIMNNAVTLRLVSALFFLGLAPLAALFFPYPSIIKIGIALTSFAFLSQILLETILGIFQKNLEMAKPAWAEFFSRAVFVLLVAALIYLKLGILFIMLALNIANFVWFLMIYLYSRKWVKIRLVFDWREWGRILRRAWPIGLSVLLNLIYLKTDVIILSIFKTQEEVGLYGAPYKLIDALTNFAMIFMGLILPLLAAAWTKKDSEKFQRFFQKTFNLLIIVVVPISAAGFFIGDKLMVFIAGRDFAASGNILSILLLGAGALYFGSLFAHTIVAINQQKKILWGYAADAFLSLIGYFIFIPRYSYLGAAWVTVFSETFIALIGLWVIWRAIRLRPRFIKIFIKSLLASAPMIAALYFLKTLPVLLLIGIAAIVYAIFIILFRGISREEIREIIKLKA